MLNSVLCPNGQIFLHEEIRNIKPSFADVIRSRENNVEKNQSMRNGEDNIRKNIRDRIESAPKRTRVDDENDDVEDVFQTQNRRGFAGQNGGGNQNRGDNQSQGGNQSDRRQSWRNKLPNCVGSGQDKQFAAPVDLFLFNVSKEASGEDIVKHIKDTKNLEILECTKVSHDDACTQSFGSRSELPTMRLD